MLYCGTIIHNMNNNTQPTASVTAVPFNPQTQKFGAVAPSTPTLPTVAPTTIPQSQNIATFGTQPINVPPANITQATIPAVNQVDQILKDTAVADTEAQKANQNISKAMLELIPQLQGQTQELATQQRVLGLPEMRQNLQNLNNQILQKQAELNQDEIRLAQSVQNIEDKPIAMEFITGQQQSVQRNAQIARALKASEIGVLNATAIGMQGNIALAQDMAKQAVETKYAPYKEALETYKLQLEALTPLLSADEKKQAREQEIKTKLAFNDIAKREKNETDISQMLVQASSQGAPSSLTEKAKLAKTPAEAASILGVYAGDYWGTKIKIAQYGKLMSESAKIASEVSAGGLGATSPVTKEDQAKFLIDTIAKANSKASAAGRSAGRRMVETWVVGSTDYTDLESQVRTLKNNLLTLATDPGIKKFFGPQMTDSDVKNMLAAATTLDTELQNPTDLKAELARTEKIFRKFAPDYVPQAPNVKDWATMMKESLNQPADTNYGYVDNKNRN